MPRRSSVTPPDGGLIAPGGAANGSCIRPVSDRTPGRCCSADAQSDIIGALFVLRFPALRHHASGQPTAGSLPPVNLPDLQISTVQSIFVPRRGRGEPEAAGGCFSVAAPRTASRKAGATELAPRSRRAPLYRTLIGGLGFHRQGCSSSPDGGQACGPVVAVATAECRTATAIINTCSLNRC